MSGWVLFLFFTTNNGPTNIVEAGFYKTKIACDEQEYKLFAKITKRRDELKKENIYLSAYPETHCIYTEHHR